MASITSAALTSSAVLPAAAGLLTSPSTLLRDIDADVREFWSSFPCPPPWRPRLLIEVNSTRLDPSVSRTVQTFLAGKCEIRHILFPSDLQGGEEDGAANNRYSPHPRRTEAPDLGSSLSDLTEARHSWCDTPCQLSIGCALFFVVVVMMVAVLVCVTKHRVRHKMAAARPSRQQLQLSTSTSDAVNCADFTNLEVQGDDDIIYPPFRHRGLPIPPVPCHPSCDPKWNCPSCASRHPLMRMSPSSHCYSRAYSAVYETIDDEDEDDDPRRTDDGKPRVRTPSKSNSRESCHSCSPCQTSPTSISTVQIRPRAFDEGRNGNQMAETGFNGDDAQNRFGISFLTNYFELEHTCALSAGASNGVSRDQACLQSFHPTDTSENVGELYQRNDQVQLFSHATTPFPKGAPPSAQQFYPPQPNAHLASNDIFPPMPQQVNTLPRHRGQDALCPRGQEANKLQELRSPSSHHTHSRNLTSEVNKCTTFLPPHSPASSGNAKSSSHPQGNTVCPMSSFEPILLPTNFYCNSCRLDGIPDFEGFPPRQRHFLASGSHQGAGVIGPDLLKEASNQIKQDLSKPTKRPETNDDNNEVPLRKPVLALHSQYFTKTSAA
ncbi:hypothetical protein BgiMline_009358 [Biomphalaria glabrata]|nr:hypothetical protein BgiMline_023491 [Biomphalaria glabrata]KAI8784952.1 hypothetical protein BgiBS90_014479 [Biomphalaria glabrata]